MPALALERQICDWVEEPREEADWTPIYTSGATTAYIQGSQGEPYLKLKLEFRCPPHEVDPAQDIWDLAYAIRIKVAREDIEEYETERLIEEINEAYDEEMEREDEEFLRRTKRYYGRILNSED
jgi:hypothetical protein